MNNEIRLPKETVPTPAQAAEIKRLKGQLGHKVDEAQLPELTLG